MNVRNIIEKAVDQHLIDKESTSAESIHKTGSFLKEADYKLQEAISDKTKKLHEKMVDGIIDPGYISEGYVVEEFEGQTIRRPVIDLVQQGGGMFGIALLGYTYIMEKVGIRFYSHGGTSAGGINASFLASMDNSIYERNSIFHKDDPNRQATKSELLTHIIRHTDFSSFMDRGGLVGWLQSSFFKNIKKNALWFTLLMISIIFLVVCFALFGYIFNCENGLTCIEVRMYDFFIGTLNVIALIILIYVLLVKLFGPQFGVNTGDVFYNWANTFFNLMQIQNTDDLYRRLAEKTIHPGKPDDRARLVLITANLTHNRIVKFPERAVFYWSNSLKVKPAAYLRSTMSLPFIFRAFIPSEDHYHDPNPSDKVEKKARFVDGGMLSNFPIREFHKAGSSPRFPTFGVLLSDIGLTEAELRERGSKVEPGKFTKMKLVSYIGSFIKTFRNFYDFEFIFGTPEIDLRVETVDTKNFNSLDFWMEMEDKKALFLKGADAAIRQLEKFDWNDYKPEREKLELQSKY